MYDKLLGDKSAKNYNFYFFYIIKMELDLIQASRIGNIREMMRLLDIGIDINTTDTDGNTALMHAVETGNVDIVRFLLNAHVNVNIQNTNGDTALIIALETYMGSSEIINLLLSRAEINLDIQNRNGITALMFAVETDNVDIITSLLNAGVNVNLIDANGFTAMDYTNTTQTINMLIEAGGTPTDHTIELLRGRGELTERIKRLKNKEILENIIIPNLNMIRLQNLDKNPYENPYILNLISNNLLYPIDGKKKRISKIKSKKKSKKKSKIKSKIKSKKNSKRKSKRNDRSDRSIF
jgi:hypothetical protein